MPEGVSSEARVFPLVCEIQHYAWGRPGAISTLTGQSSDGTPEAELWMGAHPKAPSALPDGTTLDAVIAEDPERWLGPDVAERFGDLPFLFKILAADEPLSIQAHPSMEQAQAGFDAESAGGLAIDDPTRSYRDPNHKPELICALTPFVAKCGFRSPDDTARLLETLAIEALEPVVAALHRPTRSGERLCAAVTQLLTLDPEPATALSQAVTAAAAALVREGDPVLAEFGPELEATADISRAFPGDIGVVVALLLNHVVLAPGEALFLSAGNMHAYLSGIGVELMASSDNVLRGGLTPKHIDVDELLRVVDWDAATIPLQRPAGPDHAYDVPVADFSLRRVELGDLPVEVHGPAIVLLTEGEGATVATTDIPVGRPVFVPHADASVSLVGRGLAWVAGVSASVARSAC